MSENLPLWILGGAVALAALVLLVPLPGGEDASRDELPIPSLQHDEPESLSKRVDSPGPDRARLAVPADEATAGRDVRSLLDSGKPAPFEKALREIAETRYSAVIDEALRFARETKDERLAGDTILAAKKSGLAYASDRLVEFFRDESRPMVARTILAAFRFSRTPGDRERLKSMEGFCRDEDTKVKISALLRAYDEK